MCVCVGGLESRKGVAGGQASPSHPSIHPAVHSLFGLGSFQHVTPESLEGGRRGTEPPGCLGVEGQGTAELELVSKSVLRGEGLRGQDAAALPPETCLQPWLAESSRLGSWDGVRASGLVADRPGALPDQLGGQVPVEGVPWTVGWGGGLVASLCPCHPPPSARGPWGVTEAGPAGRLPVGRRRGQAARRCQGRGGGPQPPGRQLSGGVVQDAPTWDSGFQV